MASLQTKITKGTEGYIVVANSLGSFGGDRPPEIFHVTVKMLRREGTSVYCLDGSEVRVEKFYLDIADAEAALDAAREDALELLAALDAAIAADTISVRDYRRLFGS